MPLQPPASLTLHLKAPIQCKEQCIGIKLTALTKQLATSLCKHREGHPSFRPKIVLFSCNRASVWGNSSSLLQNICLYRSILVIREKGYVTPEHSTKQARLYLSAYLGGVGNEGRKSNIFHKRITPVCGSLTMTCPSGLKALSRHFIAVGNWGNPSLLSLYATWDQNPFFSDSEHCDQDFK